MKAQGSVIMRYLLLVVCALSLLLLCSCSEIAIDTQLSIDENFSGKRTMSFTIEDGGLLNSFDAQEAADALEENCPPELEMTQESKGGDILCHMTMSFSDIKDYTSKIKNLLGRTPNITFEPASDEWYTYGLSLSEDFTSADLAGWAKEVIAAKYPKYKDKLVLSAEDGQTVVIYNGEQYTCGAKISLAQQVLKLDGVTVSTTRYGENDYDRSVTIAVSAEVLQKIGKDRFVQEVISPRIADVQDICTYKWNSDSTAVTVSLSHGTFEELEQFTCAMFPGSEVSYDASSDEGPFHEAGTLSDRLEIEGFVCNDDLTANVAMIYNAADGTELGVGEGSAKPVKQENGSLQFAFDSAKSVSISTVNKTVYKVESITVSTGVSFSENVTVAITLTFPQEISGAASARAAEFLRSEYKGSGVDIDCIYDQSGVSDSEVKNSALVIMADGTAEEVSKKLNAAFGDGNAIELVQSSDFGFYTRGSITHDVNISALTEQADYSGEIIYVFSGSMCKVRLVRLQSTTGSTINDDMLGGETRSNTFTSSPINTHNFRISYKYDHLNILAMVVAVLAGAAVLCALAFVYKLFGRKLIAKQANKKEDIRYEAVKSVALACVPENERGEVLQMPSELVHRPTVIIRPKVDDGLDDDDDDPESIILFSMAIRILTVVAIVLFFMPFWNIQRTGALLKDSSTTISGWGIFNGNSVFGVDLEPYRFALVLLIIPVLMLVALLARRKLPSLVLPVVLTGGSLFALFYMLSSLPGVGTEMFEYISANVAEGRVMSPTLQMGYNYSIVIYVLIAIGGIVLLFSTLLAYAAKKRRQRDEEMHRFRE